MKMIYHHRTQVDDAQGVHITEMCNAFSEIGYEVKVFSLVQANKDLSEKEKGKSWEIITKFAPAFLYEIMELVYNFYGYFKLKKLIREFEPDFIYERYASFNFCGILAARHTKTKICLEVNSPLYLEKMKYGKLVFRKIAKYIENWVCDNATVSLVVTSVLRNILIEQGVKKVINVMPNGVNRKHFEKGAINSNIREEYQIHKNDIVIGIISWYRKWHGLDLLIKTCHENNLFTSKNIRLFVIGDGPALAECKTYTSDNDLEDSVIFTGPIQRRAIPAYLSVMDIAVQSRVTDYACPMKIIEYLVMGKAIIAPDQLNIREILIDNNNALLFQPDNTQDLFSKIESLCNNKRQRIKLARSALQTIKDKRLTWVDNAKKTVKLLGEEVKTEIRY